VGKSKRSAARASKKRSIIITVIIIAVLLSLAAGAMIAGAVYGKRISESTVNLPGVHIGEVNVGGLTKDETVAALDASGREDALEGVFIVNLPEDVVLRLNVIRAGAVLTNEAAADAAYAYGHTGDVFADLFTYLRCRAVPTDLSGSAASLNEEYIKSMLEKGAKLFAKRTSGEEYTLDEENNLLVFRKGLNQLSLDVDSMYDAVVASVLAGESECTIPLPEQSVTMPDFDALFKEMSAEPADAYYDRDTDSVVYETVGVSFDVDGAKQLWNSAAILEDVSVPVRITIPEVRGAELEALLFRDKLGGRTTNYWGSTEARCGNIALAAERLNGIILMPGESLSYNETIGERTEAGGYKAAPAYNGDQVEDQVGGGICQVSSTLYFTTLQADLQIDARTCHNFAVAYLPYGLDATVSWGQPDFAFTNDREYPIRIVAYTDYAKRALTIEIWGTNLDGTYIEPMSAWWATYDEMYPSVQVGWGAVSYRYKYDADGSLLDKIFEDESEYALHKEDIDWPEGVDPNDPHAPIEEKPSEEGEGGETDTGGEEAPPESAPEG